MFYIKICKDGGDMYFDESIAEKSVKLYLYLKIQKVNLQRKILIY